MEPLDNPPASCMSASVAPRARKAAISSLIQARISFQRLGYFAACAEIPAPIIRHVFRCAALAELPEQLQAYDASTARDRHTALIREFLGVTAYGPAAREVVAETCLQAARTRDDLHDLINMAIEELIRQRFELPAFSTLLRIARATRNTVNTTSCASVNCWMRTHGNACWPFSQPVSRRITQFVGSISSRMCQATTKQAWRGLFSDRPLPFSPARD